MEGNSLAVIFMVGLIPLVTLASNSTNTTLSPASNSSSLTVTNSSSNATKNSTDGLDSRMNLNIGFAHSQKQDENGSSDAHAGSFAFDIGRKTGNKSETLLSNSGAHSGGTSSGPNAPLVFANSTSSVGDGFVNGTASAGSVGGGGNSEAYSTNDHMEIDMGDGTTIFSNLPQKGNSTKGNSTSSSESTTLPPSDNTTTTRPKGASKGGLVLINNN